jgi:hypothetical protein
MRIIVISFKEALTDHLKEFGHTVIYKTNTNGIVEEAWRERWLKEREGRAAMMYVELIAIKEGLPGYNESHS